jgi:hypothetical protein
MSGRRALPPVPGRHSPTGASVNAERRKARPCECTVGPSQLSAQDDYAAKPPRMASRRSAATLITLIIGLIAGPAVSL